jgi:hypothetical protein
MQINPNDLPFSDTVAHGGLPSSMRTESNRSLLRALTGSGRPRSVARALCIRGSDVGS